MDTQNEQPQNNDPFATAAPKPKQPPWECYLCGETWPQNPGPDSLKARKRANMVHPNVPCRKPTPAEFKEMTEK